jgi:urocanate hydratase
LPDGLERRQWQEMRERDPAAVAGAARISIARHVEAMLSYREMGVPVFDYGNNIRQEAKDMASNTPSTSPASCPLTSAFVLPRHRPVPLGRH